MNVSSVERQDGRRAVKNAATAAALLDAAAETFAQRGFEAATMDEIAERVGLTKGALYYRYKSKEDLFIALLDERCRAYIRQLDEAFAGVVERQSHEAGVELPICAERVALGISALCNGLAVERLADPSAVPDEAFVELPALLMLGVAARTQRTTSKRAEPRPHR